MSATDTQRRADANDRMSASGIAAEEIAHSMAVNRVAIDPNGTCARSLTVT